MSKPVVSIVIPAYNEGARIRQTVHEVLDYFAANDRFLLKEIIVVDDGSGDDTGEQLAACRDQWQSLVVVTHPQNEGKGAAVKSGVLRASGDIVLFMDADLSTPLRCADRLLDALERGADVVIGSRALRDAKLTRRQPAYRELSGRLFNLFVQFLFLGACGIRSVGSNSSGRQQRKIFFGVCAYPVLHLTWSFFTWPKKQHIR